MIVTPKFLPPRQAVTPIRLNRGSPYARGLVAWYPLGDAQSWGNGYTVYDHSGYGQHGTADSQLLGYGEAQWSAAGWTSSNLGGVTRGAAPGLWMDSDPVNVSTTGGPLQLLNGPCAISCWVQGTSGTGLNTIIGQNAATPGHEFIKRLDYTWYQARFAFSAADGSYQIKRFNHDLGEYDWDFIGVSIRGDLSGGDGIFFINDSYTTFTAAAFSSTPDTTVPVLIGGSEAGGSMKGQIRDLRVWNRPLTLSDFKRLFRETGGRATGKGFEYYTDGGPFQPYGYGSLAQQFRPIPRAAEAVETTAQSAPIFLATTQAGL